MADHPDAFGTYREIVKQWAPRLDLVSPGDIDRFDERHISDALRVLPLLEGSSAGPFAIASGRYVRLIEPRRRRAAFLEECLRRLGLAGEVVAITAEQAADDPRYAAAHPFAVARALAPPVEALKLILPFVASGGTAAVYLGAGAKMPPNSEEFAPGIAIVRAD